MTKVSEDDLIKQADCILTDIKMPGNFQPARLDVDPSILGRNIKKKYYFKFIFPGWNVFK